MIQYSRFFPQNSRIISKPSNPKKNQISKQVLCQHTLFDRKVFSFENYRIKNSIFNVTLGLSAFSFIFLPCTTFNLKKIGLNNRKIKNLFFETEIFNPFSVL